MEDARFVNALLRPWSVSLDVYRSLTTLPRVSPVQHVANDSLLSLSEEEDESSVPRLVSAAPQAPPLHLYHIQSFWKKQPVHPSRKRLLTPPPADSGSRDDNSSSFFEDSILPAKKIRVGGEASPTLLSD